MSPNNIVVSALLLLLICCCSTVLSVLTADFPLPFKRQLSVGSEGNDVHILQELLKRSPAVPKGLHMKDKVFDADTAHALELFQTSVHLSKTGKMDIATADAVLRHLMADQYKPKYCFSVKELPSPYKYIVDIPLYANRSIETVGTLFDRHCNALHRFQVRTHGQANYNELTSNGNTPTGMYTFDLNTPEPDPKSYGPYNVNRAVFGLEGNAKVVIPYIRNGILLHTGQWDNWNTSKPMPNSHGCMHAWPRDVKLISDILTQQLGVVAHENPFGKLPYPFDPQGLLSIWRQD